LNSSDHKFFEVLLVLLAGVCLTASGLCAVKNSTPNKAHKPAARRTANSTSRHATTITSSAAKKPGTFTTASHSATNYRVAHHSGTAHNAARKTAGHESIAVAAKKEPNHTTASASQHKGPAVHVRHPRSTQPSTLSGQQRLARAHLQPERVEEIQQALIREGYLKGDTNGQWDTRTREAMLRYQTMHGFPATGLPEAKSLMKLGLGSHPLPPELDHGAVGVASSGVIQNVQSVFSVSPDSPPETK
jgi:anti-sigma28 factor (negative regulator of flagellin synthesis)